MKLTARLSGMMERLPPTPEPLSSGFLKIRHVEQFGRRFRQPELRLPQYPSKVTIVGLQYHERAIVFHRERRLDYRSAPNIGLAKQFAVRGGTRYGQHRAKLGSANS